VKRDIEGKARKAVRNVKLGASCNEIFRHFFETAEQAYSFEEFLFTAQTIITGRPDLENIEDAVLASVVAVRYYAFRRAISKEGPGRQAFRVGLDIGAGDKIIDLVRTFPLRFIKHHGDPFDLGFDPDKFELRLRKLVDDFSEEHGATTGTEIPIGTGLNGVLSSFLEATPELSELASKARAEAVKKRDLNASAPPKGLAFYSPSQREMALRICHMMDLEVFRRKGEKRTTLNVHVSEQFYEDHLDPLMMKVFQWQSNMVAAASTEIERVLFQATTDCDFSYSCKIHGINTWPV